MINENLLTHKIIGAAIEVHRNLGPGLLESVYEECLAKEFEIYGLKFERQKTFPVSYKGFRLNSIYRVDFLIENQVVLEIKSVRELDPVFSCQVLTYLRLLDIRIGLLINFNVPILKDGVKRIVNNFKEDPIPCTF
jgi:GxxExxY protein